MTRMADELGLLVWSEIPVYWRVDWANPATLATARNDAARKHPARSQSRFDHPVERRQRDADQ